MCEELLVIYLREPTNRYYIVGEKVEWLYSVTVVDRDLKLSGSVGIR